MRRLRFENFVSSSVRSWLLRLFSLLKSPEAVPEVGVSPPLKLQAVEKFNDLVINNVIQENREVALKAGQEERKENVLKTESASVTSQNLVETKNSPAILPSEMPRKRSRLEELAETAKIKREALGMSNEEYIAFLVVQSEKEKQQRKREEKLNSPEAKKALELSEKPVHLTMYRNEQNLMRYPFCSISRQKRLETLEYRSASGERWLEVTANHKYGMAKIWDFDILRYAISKAGEISWKCEFFPSRVTISPYECLKALGKNVTAGKNYAWFRGALMRLTTTTYLGNIFREDIKIEDAFALISYKKIKRPDRRFDRIEITFNERIVESICCKNGILSIDPAVVQETSGIKKRLLELVKMSMGAKKEWEVGIKQLHNMCACEGKIRRFKHELPKMGLPWEINFGKNTDQEDKVIFSVKRISS